MKVVFKQSKQSGTLWNDVIGCVVVPDDDVESSYIVLPSTNKFEEDQVALVDLEHPQCGITYRFNRIGNVSEGWKIYRNLTLTVGE